MSNFNPNTTKQQSMMTEMSPLFHVMRNIQYQYTEIQDDDEVGDQAKRQNSSSATSSNSGADAAQSPLVLHRNGWFGRRSDSDVKLNESTSPHWGILFVSVLVCIGLGFAVTSVGSADNSARPWQNDNPINIQSTKMTLVPIETVGDARSVKVITGNGVPAAGVEEVILAEGLYITNYKGEGWNHLRVHMPNIPLTNDYDYFERYFMGWEAMGFLEGFVTCTEMQSFYVNLYHGLFDGGDIVPEAVAFLVENHDWVRNQAEANWRTSEYWLAVKATLIQMTGMLNGLRAGCPTAAGGPTEFDVYSSTSIRTLHDFPTLVNLLILQANGDLYQIAAKYNQQNAPAASDDDFKYTNPPPSNNISMFFDDDNHIKQAIKDMPAVSMVEKHLRSIRGRKLAAKARSLGGPATTLDPSAVQHIGSDHCSAFIRLLPDNSDVIFAHNTWDDFQNAAPRIFKQYSFPQPHYRHAQGVTTTVGSNGNGVVGGSPDNGESLYQPESIIGEASNNMRGGNDKYARKDEPSAPTLAPSGVPATSTYSVLSSTMVNIHFSSSPGFLSSVDDFYTIAGNGDMAVIETSLDIYDTTLLTQVHYDSVLSWMRVRIANQYAESGDHWARLFALYHSGTYVNQWLVIDYAKFTPGVAPAAGSGLLTVLEEMPGYIFWEDVTTVLSNQGYWASFNDAYFEVVRQMSGAELMCEENTNFCYQSDPRNEIFMQRAPKVTSIDEAKALIRYNNWHRDLNSRNDSCLGVSLGFLLCFCVVLLVMYIAVCSRYRVEWI
jgi:hypothetical protein